ncbi:MAG: neutral zinc metallopeptidase [Thermomicrobiales bacterium]
MNTRGSGRGGGWRHLAVLLVTVLALGFFGPLSGTVAAAAATRQSTSDEQGVRTAISDLDRFAQAGNMSAYYDRLAPAFRNLVPRSAWLAWTAGNPDAIPASAEATGEISFGDWTWDATGDDLEDVAIVAAGTSDLHFVNDGTRWRLIPDLDPETVNAEGNADGDFSYTSPIDDPDYAKIDEFWARSFHDAGKDDAYRAPGGVVDVTSNAQISAGCGTAKQIEDRGMYYCTIDETIYYSGEFRDLVIDNVGEWAWITGVAHEWGHHIQQLMGFDQSSDPELDQGYYTIELELQADCLSGMYSQDALARGEIGDKQIREADAIMEAIGDPTGTKWDDPDAHGTSEQRQASFTNGFDNGFLGCRVDLADAG